MNNPFPSSYYVYKHIDRWDRGGTIIYVGHGTGARAWTCNLPHRDEEHAKALHEFMQRGEIPSDWVQIEKKGLTKQEACELERRLIRMFRPRFNKVQGAALLKVTPELLEQAFELREKGLSYSKIAEELALGTMTIHRAMAGKSPALEEILERQN